MWVYLWSYREGRKPLYSLVGPNLGKIKMLHILVYWFLSTKIIVIISEIMWNTVICNLQNIIQMESRWNSIHYRCFLNMSSFPSFKHIIELSFAAPLKLKKNSQTETLQAISWCIIFPAHKNLSFCAILALGCLSGILIVLYVASVRNQLLLR